MNVTLKGYGDESADATRSRVFAVAAVIGSEDEWQLAMREWLRRTRGKKFHATDCESEFADDPDPQKHKDNLKLYADLTQILAQSYLVGYAYALDLQSHREIFSETAVADWAYYKCFSDLVSAATRTAVRFNASPDEASDVRFEFTFDSRKESNGTAGVLYSMLVNHPDWRGTDILNATPSFQSVTIEPRLEMGDLLAREAMKELDRKITKSTRPTRRSRAALDNAVVDGVHKFQFIERDREYWLKLKAMVEKPEAAELMAEWDQWLSRTGNAPNGRPIRNMNNWILFNAWIDKQDVLRKKYDGALSSVV